MANNSLNYEDYPAVGDFLITSFQVDQSEFLKRYQKMDAVFLTDFKKAVDEVRELASVFAKTEDLKKTTSQLYDLADKINEELLFLLDYLKYEGLSTKAVSQIRTKFSKRNIEGGIKELRDVAPFLNENKNKLEAGDMPTDFIQNLYQDIPQMEQLNVKQNEFLNSRKGSVQENLKKFEVANKFFSRVCSAGKKIFKQAPKKDEYTMTKLIKRVRVTKLDNIKKTENNK